MSCQSGKQSHDDLVSPPRVPSPLIFNAGWVEIMMADSLGRAVAIRSDLVCHEAANEFVRILIAHSQTKPMDFEASTNVLVDGIIEFMARSSNELGALHQINLFGSKIEVAICVPGSGKHGLEFVEAWVHPSIIARAWETLLLSNCSKHPQD